MFNRIKAAFTGRGKKIEQKKQASPLREASDRRDNGSSSSDAASQAGLIYPHSSSTRATSSTDANSCRSYGSDSGGSYGSSDSGSNSCNSGGSD